MTAAATVVPPRRAVCWPSSTLDNDDIEVLTFVPLTKNNVSCGCTDARGTIARAPATLFFRLKAKARRRPSSQQHNADNSDYSSTSSPHGPSESGLQTGALTLRCRSKNAQQNPSSRAFGEQERATGRSSLESLASAHAVSTPNRASACVRNTPHALKDGHLGAARSLHHPAAQVRVVCVCVVRRSARTARSVALRAACAGGGWERESERVCAAPPPSAAKNPSSLPLACTHTHTHAHPTGTCTRPSTCSAAPTAASRSRASTSRATTTRW